jgi:hypothetical protein
VSDLPPSPLATDLQPFRASAAMKRLNFKSNKETSRRYTLEQQDRYVEVMEQVQPAKKKVVPRPSSFLAAHSINNRKKETNRFFIYLFNILFYFGRRATC